MWMMEKFCLVFTMPWISFTIINIPPTVRQVSPNLFFFLPNHIYPLIYPSYGHHLQSSTSRRLLDRYPLSSSSLSLITYILSILIRCSVQHVPPLPLTVTSNHTHRLIHFSSYFLTVQQPSFWLVEDLGLDMVHKYMSKDKVYLIVSNNPDKTEYTPPPTHPSQPSTSSNQLCSPLLIILLVYR